MSATQLAAFVASIIGAFIFSGGALWTMLQARPEQNNVGLRLVSFGMGLLAFMITVFGIAMASDDGIPTPRPYSDPCRVGTYNQYPSSDKPVCVEFR